MKNILTLLLLVLSLNVFAQEQQQATNTYSTTEIDLKLQLQQQEVRFLQKDMTEQKESVRESIDRQERYIQKTDKNISWWIAFLGIWVTLISIGIAIFGFLINRRTKESKKEVEKELDNIKKIKKEIDEQKKGVEEEAENIKKLKKEVEGEVKNINSLKTEVEELKKEIEEIKNEVEKTKEKVLRDAKEIVEKLQSTKDVSLEQKEKVKKVVEEIREIKPEAEYSYYDWFLKGYNAGEEKKYSDACFYYQKAIELKPDYAAAYNNWGGVLTDLAKQKGDESLYYESIEKYKKAIELNPDDADTYYNWGDALTDLAKQKGDESLYYEGIEKYKEAIELKPDYAAAYNNLGSALMSLAQQKDNLEEKKDEIVELLSKAEALENRFGSWSLAELYALLNEKEAALVWLERSLQYTEKSPREHYERDEDFNNIKEDPRFKALLDKYFKTKQ